MRSNNKSDLRAREFIRSRTRSGIIILATPDKNGSTNYFSTYVRGRVLHLFAARDLLM